MNLKFHLDCQSSRARHHVMLLNYYQSYHSKNVVFFIDERRKENYRTYFIYLMNIHIEKLILNSRMRQPIRPSLYYRIRKSTVIQLNQQTEREKRFKKNMIEDMRHIREMGGCTHHKRVIISSSYRRTSSMVIIISSSFIIQVNLCLYMQDNVIQTHVNQNKKPGEKVNKWVNGKTNQQ